MDEANVIVGSGPLSSSSSLVPLETTSHPLRWSRTASQQCLHHQWADERERVIVALLNGNAALEKRGHRIDGCCSHPSLTVKANGSVSMVLYCCRDRLCPRCQMNRGRTAARRITTVITAMNAPRKIELTVRHREAPLASSIDRLWEAFRVLRRSKFWRKNVRAGVGVLEITINGQDRTWHPHLHIVYDGSYIPQSQLAAVWEEITKDSRVVWIEAVHDRAATATYIGRYLAKCIDPREMAPAEIREYASALHGRRLVFTFGAAHNSNPDPTPEAESHVGDSPLLSVHRLTGSADAGNPRAQKAVDLLRGISPVWCSALGYLPVAGSGRGSVLTLAEDRFIIEVCNEILNETAVHDATAEADQAAARVQAVELHQLSLQDFAAPPPTPYL